MEDYPVRFTFNRRYLRYFSPKQLFVIFRTLTSAIAPTYAAQSTEMSVSEPAKFGFQEFLAASKRAWAAATHAFNLLTYEFSLGNVIMHSKCRGVLPSNVIQGVEQDIIAEGDMAPGIDGSNT